MKPRKEPEFHLAEWLANRQKQLPKTLVFLKRLARSRLPFQQVQSVHNEVFQRIDCLQCGNCCKTASPVFTRTDAERIAGFLGMKTGKFETTFLKPDHDGDLVPQQIPCPFLNPDYTCRVYEVRPKSCRNYPHTDTKEAWERPVLLAKNTITCPAAFQIVEKIKTLIS